MKTKRHLSPHRKAFLDVLDADSRIFLLIAVLAFAVGFLIGCYAGICLA